MARAGEGSSISVTEQHRDAKRGETGALSIRRKLFLVIVGLLAAVTGFYSWAAYREMRAAALAATSMRLDGIATQWANLMATSRRQSAADFRRILDAPALREFMTTADSGVRTRLADSLGRMFGVGAGGPRRAVQLFDVEYRELLRLGAGGEWLDRYDNRALVRAATSDSGAVGDLVAIGDTITAATANQVVMDGRPRGTVVSWGRISLTPGRDAINRLFGGQDTRLMMANRSGDVWTDLERRVASPNVNLAGASSLLTYRRPGEEPVVAMARPVAGTPWSIVVEHSSAAVTAQARDFLKRASLVGGIALLLGALGALALSVSLTRPLGRLTRAAEAVAAGDYSRQSGLTRRRDELGRLSAAFDSMVARVQESFAAHGASEERYRLLFESVPLPLWVFDRETLRILAVNQAAVEHYGYSRDEFLALNPADVRPAEDVALLRSAIANVDDPRHRGGSWRHVKKDGTRIEVETSGVSIDFGGCAARIAIMRDVTDRNRAADALRRSEERYRRLVREAPIGVTLESAGGRFLVVNPGFVAMLGHDSEDAVLMLQAGDVYASDEQRRSLLGRLRAGGQIKREELQLIRKDGTLITTQYAGRLVTDLESGDENIEATWEDVTNQRRIERQFHQAQKMEAIGLLAGGIAHDFNNLLTIIISSSDMLLADAARDFAHRGDVEAIRTAGKSAAALTRQLLAFSRQQVLQPRVMQLNDLIDSITRLLKRIIGENIDLITVLAPDAGRVKVDPGQMEQVIVNLGVNARDAMPNGGRLLIESRNVEFAETLIEHHTLYPAGRYVTLTVSDTGVGMDRDTQARVFEPFFSTKEPGAGTGLGLATVYGIVRQSGGFISVYSEPGEGSSFKIYFPRVDEPAALDEPTRLTDAMRGSETILVVEDAPAVRSIMVQVLRRLGYSVIEAHDGEGAIALSASHDGAVHLLLTDVIMPRMGGRALASQIVKDRPGIRVIFVSGYTDDAIVRHGVLAAGMHYLEKPFTPDILATKVRQVLDSGVGYSA